MCATRAAAAAAAPAVVTVGDELVRGERPRNDNERWMLEELARRDRPAALALQVGDDAVDIGEAVAFLLRRGHAFVLVSGGVGGTHDDKTREGVARAVGRPLVRHAECAEALRKKYEASADGLTEERQRMSMLPEGAALLPNPIGAPGFSVDDSVFCVPGFPTMMRPMLTAVLDRVAPAPDADDLPVTHEVQLPLAEAAIAAEVESFEAEWAARGASVGLYPSTEQYGRMVKVRLRHPAGATDVREAFDALIATISTRLV